MPRKHYDLSKVDGRKQYEGTQEKSLFVEELVDWLRTSKHEKRTEKTQSGTATENLYTKQEVLKLQALYYEERRRCQDL